MSLIDRERRSKQAHNGLYKKRRRELLPTLNVFTTE